MRSEYTAVIKHDGKDWIGWMEEVPGVNAQEDSGEELMKSLHEALTDVLHYNREHVLRTTGGDYQLH